MKPKKVSDKKFPKGKKEVFSGSFLAIGEKNPHVHGVLLRQREIYNKLRKADIPVWDLETEAGVVTVTGGMTLEGKMSKVEPGQRVYITFTGTVPTSRGKKPAKIYSVSVD